MKQETHSKEVLAIIVNDQLYTDYCPFCQRIHKHGPGDSKNSDNGSYGGRVAHCTGDYNHYILIKPNDSNEKRRLLEQVQKMQESKSADPGRNPNVKWHRSGEDGSYSIKE